MKIKRPWIMAVITGVLSLIFAWGYLQMRVATYETMEEPITVLVANRDILEGKLLDESLFQTQKIPRRFVQPKVVLSFDEVIGKVTLTSVFKGEQMLKTKLIPLGAKSGLAVKIPEGYRALSVPVDAVSGVVGLIRPNNFVDLVVTFETQDSAESIQVGTYTIAQHILVLAVDDDLGTGPPLQLISSNQKKRFLSGEKFANAISKVQKRTVTLALTPKQIQEIEFAKQQGKLSLVLRGQWDKEKIELKPATLFSLTGMNGKIQHRFREYRGN